MTLIRDSIVFVLCVSGLIGSTVSLAADERAYAVVASANLGEVAAEVDATLIRLLYLKELSEWPDGVAARPIGRPADSEAHRRFLEGVLDMDSRRFEAHWASLKQRTGQGAVHAISSDAHVVVLLKRFQGAFAVLPVGIADADPELIVLLDLP